MKKLLGFLGSIGLIFGLWAFVHFTPVPLGINIDNLWAATQAYPKDNLTFIQVPQIFRGVQVKDKDLTAPPGSPAEGDRYIPKATATGAWAGKENQIAEWHARSGSSATWYFYDPPAGYQTWVTDEGKIYVFNGSAWVISPITIPAGSITDSMISDTAAIKATKIADGSVNDTEFQYINSVTSNVQAQINGKQATITGGASTVTDTNLTVQRALISNVSGKISVSTTTETELSYVSGVTSAIQSQFSGKEPTITAGIASQYWRGDKSWQSLFTAVDESFATDTDVTGKEPTITAGVVSQYYRGDKVFVTLNLDALADVIASGAAQGDILYFDTDQWKILPAGTSGWFLKTQGAAANPVWVSIPGGGDMLKSIYDVLDDGMVDTAQDLSLTGQSAGDIVYFNGTNWVRLGKDIDKFLKSGVSAVSWGVPAGAGTVIGTGTAGKITKWVGSSEVGDATNTDTDNADAVAKKHTRGHTLGDITDHTDVDTTGLADGQALIWNTAQSKWLPGSAGGVNIGDVVKIIWAFGN